MARQVFFLGDSFTAGQGDPAGLGWTGRLLRAADERGLAVRATNLGVGGATTEQIARHWERAVTVRERPADDVRLILCAGANDTTSDGAEGTWVDRAVSEASLASVLDRASALGYRAFVLGPGPAGLPEQDARSAVLDASFGRICAGRGIPFLSILTALLADDGWMGECAAGDGLHPGASGYARLAELAAQGGLLDWLGRS